MKKYFIGSTLLCALLATLFLAHLGNESQVTIIQTPAPAGYTMHAVSYDGANATAAAQQSTSSPNASPTSEQTSYTVPVLADETALSAMQAYASSSDFTFTGREYPSLGFFVDSINGKSNADGKYWILYINGTSSALGASSAEVAPGESVEWRYETSY